MNSQPENTQPSSQALQALVRVNDALKDRLVGHETLIERLLIGLLTGGHLLLEGAPGLAKTKAIKTFADLLEVEFVRVQSTPDLLPADITGTDVYHQQSGEFRFLSGPLFHNVVLFDEINRAPPKVQSALLEAMGERQITTGGVTRALDEPFLVAATQNPIEHEGTYPLPEAQLDRFMFFVNVDMPAAAQERQILDHVLRENTGELPTIQAVCTANDISTAKTEIKSVHLSEAVRDYIVRLIAATRGEGNGGDAAKNIAQPASPRGSIFLALSAQARAWLNGKNFVTPDDVSELAPDVLCGRIALDYQARAEGITSRALIHQILDATPKI